MREEKKRGEREEDTSHFLAIPEAEKKRAPYSKKEARARTLIPLARSGEEEGGEKEKLNSVSLPPRRRKKKRPSEGRKKKKVAPLRSPSRTKGGKWVSPPAPFPAIPREGEEKEGKACTF